MRRASAWRRSSKTRGETASRGRDAGDAQIAEFWGRAMTYRIIQWGTGNVGNHALRLIVDRPDYDLVGVRVYNPDKIGCDAGELIGRGDVGVLATDDVDAILALDAECACYTALGTLGDQSGALDDICRLLASGKSVVSSAIEHHAYLRPGVAPASTTEARERITAACIEGGTSFFHIGINPGFTMDLWPITLSRLCRRIDQLKAVEIVDMSRYSSRQIVSEALGFGMPPDYVSNFDRVMSDVFESPFYISMRMLADALGIELDDVRYSRENALADQAFSIAAGSVEAGTVAAMKLHLDGILKDRVVIAFEFVWRVSNQVATDWPTGDSRWLVQVTGDPTIESSLKLATTEGSGRATSLAVATLLLNSVPSVVAAPPGPLDNLTIPTHGGGYFAS
jgi:4-hydroxy-tetrahydrodipicolinate reductase